MPAERVATPAGGALPAAFAVSMTLTELVMARLEAGGTNVEKYPFGVPLEMKKRLGAELAFSWHVFGAVVPFNCPSCLSHTHTTWSSK